MSETYENKVRAYFPNAHYVTTHYSIGTRYNIWPHLSYFGEIPIGDGYSKKEAWENAYKYVELQIIRGDKNE